MPPALRKVACILLLGAGIALWGVWLHFALPTRLQLGLLAAVFVIAMVPEVSRRFSGWLDRIRHPSAAVRRITAIAIFVLGTVYLATTGFVQHRELFPRYHDENMHLLQMRFLSTGRLWTASHPMSDFFESFHTIVTPVYASMYFPGTAIMYVWEIWLDTPHWLGPVVVSGLCLSLLYLIVTELLDDAVAGLLAAVFLLSVQQFRYLSMVVMSHLSLIGLGLALVWAYLHWRKKQDWRWAMAIGALAGWAAITRPVDAICYAAPVGLAMLANMRHRPRREILRTIALIGICAAPFLAAQFIFDKGVTGHFLKTPYQLYTEQSSPEVAYGSLSLDSTVIPHTNLQQKIFYDMRFNRPALEKSASMSPVAFWLKAKFPVLMTNGLPCAAMLILLPIGFLALGRKSSWVLFGMLPAYIVGYAFFAFLLPHYCAVPAPALALLAVLCIPAVCAAFPSLRDYFQTTLTLALLVLSIFSLHEFTGALDDIYTTPLMRSIALEMPAYVKPPAVVLFHYTEGHENVHEEPVFNLDTVNPDEAPVIRAQDLGRPIPFGDVTFGERDKELFAYYARTQPDRKFYLFDRAERHVTYLGTATELAEYFHLDLTKGPG